MLRKQPPIPLCDSRDSSFRVRAAQMMQETALARGRRRKNSLRSQFWTRDNQKMSGEWGSSWQEEAEGQETG